MSKASKNFSEAVDKVQRRKEEDRAHSIIEQFADADMSADEIHDLLVHNGISEQVAQGIASDMRPSP
jgi:hypothetical protein